MDNKDRQILAKILRNRIVHGYSGVNMNIVWDTIQEDLPILKQEIEKYM